MMMKWGFMSLDVGLTDKGQALHIKSNTFLVVGMMERQS